MKLYLHVDGERRGPFELAEVNAQIAEGKLSPYGVDAWYKGRDNWMPLENLPGVVIPPSLSRSDLPPAHSRPAASEQGGDSTGGLIPYKNPHALIGYYLGIVGLFPLIGILFSIPAFILGIIGLKKRSQNPIIKGSVHAWIAIVLGFIATSYNGLMILGIIVALSQAGRR